MLRFDESDDEMECTSVLPRGLTVEKCSLRGGAVSQRDNAADFIENLPSAKQLTDYDEIMEILGK